MDIEKEILILAIYKKEEDENLNDVILKLVNSNVFNKKKGKKLLEELKNDKILIDDKLSFLGLSLAKDINNKFII